MTTETKEPQETEAEEVIQGEVVSEAETKASEQNQAIEHIAEAALMSPGVPGREEFLNLCLQAKLLSMSGAVPKALRAKPHLCLHLVLLARDLGISPTSGVNMIDFIPDTDGGGNFSLSPELLKALVRQKGLGSIETPSQWQSSTRGVAIALGPGGHIDYDIDGNVTAITGEIGRSEFTWEQAQEAGLAGKLCQPGDHKVTNNGKCACRQGYRTYSKNMMMWRATGGVAHTHFPEATLGLYTPEELGAMTDENGQMIDPATVAVPPGYELTTGSSDSSQNRDTRRGQPKSSQDVDKLFDALSRRIGALDDEGREDLLDQWKNARLPILKKGRDQFSDAQVKFADKLLRQIEEKRRKAGWNPDIGNQSTDLPQAKPATDTVGTIETSSADPVEDDDGSAEDVPTEITTFDPSAYDADTVKMIEGIVADLTDEEVLESLGEYDDPRIEAATFVDDKTALRRLLTEIQIMEAAG